MDYVKAALAEDCVVSLDSDCDAFEHELEEFVGEDKKVAAHVSGTAALHMALIACGVSFGDEMMVQSSTFCASINSIAYLDATPVFVDLENKTWIWNCLTLPLPIVSR